jgi:hypothetical protein
VSAAVRLREIFVVRADREESPGFRELLLSGKIADPVFRGRLAGPEEEILETLTASGAECCEPRGLANKIAERSGLTSYVGSLNMWRRQTE